ncbi:FkbM family methyltransferase [Candidatus Pelagibacter sp.]|nr:FkbM family methyltransferase [Candidatus Pelagibacter sp.]
MKVYDLLNLVYWKIYFILKFFQIKIGNNTTEIFLLKNIYKTIGLPNILDIGANKGQKTDIFLCLNFKSKVKLFEPFKEYFIRLKKKYKNLQNIEIYNFGVGKFNSNKNFFISKEKQNSEAFSFKKMPYHNKKVTVKIRKIDTYFKYIKKIDLIKIDVEQLEIDVLIGAKSLIKNDRPIIFLETTNANINKIETYFQKLNFIIYAYEYYIFKDGKFVFENPILSWTEKNVQKSNVYGRKLYPLKVFKNIKSYMLNLIAIPKEKGSIIKNLSVEKSYE